MVTELEEDDAILEFLVFVIEFDKIVNVDDVVEDKR